MTLRRRLLVLSIFFALFFPALAQAAVIGYLRIQDIEGEVTTAPYEGYIEVLGFGQGITLPVTASAATYTTGIPDFQDIRITKAIDKTSPLLYLRLAQGTTISEVEIKFLKEGAVYYTIELTDAIITGVAPAMGSAASTEMISFAFARIHWTVITDGGNVESGWNVLENTSL